MTVSFENTTEDAAAWTAAYLTRTRPGRAVAKRARILVPVLMGFLVLLEMLYLGRLRGGGPSFAPLLIALTTGIIVYLSQALGVRRRTRQMAAKLVRSGHFELFLGPKEVSVLPQGLRTVWPNGETLVKWSGIRRVEADETHLQIFLTETEFLTIPKRAFHSEAEERGFIALMERYRTAGELGTALPAMTAAALPAAVAPLPAAANAPAPTTHAPGAPWWRSRDSVDTGAVQVNRRA